jgi:hypothetical protein
MVPDYRSGLRIERNDPAVSSHDEEQVLDATRRSHAFEKYRRTVGGGRKRGFELRYQRADVTRRDDRFGGVVAAMLWIAAELQPVVGPCGCHRDWQRKSQCSQTLYDPSAM